MDINNDYIVQLGLQLTELAFKGTVSKIQQKIETTKSLKNDKKTLELYDEIVNELIEDRAEAIRIAQTYKIELDKYEISDKDIEHLHNTLTKILNIIQEMSPGVDLSSFENFKELVNVDTLKAMQLVGFNYKKAIGEPLTELCSRKISGLDKKNKNK